MRGSQPFPLGKPPGEEAGEAGEGTHLLGPRPTSILIHVQLPSSEQRAEVGADAEVGTIITPTVDGAWEKGQLARGHRG